MKIDLRHEFSDIYAHLVKQVKGFEPSGRNVLGSSGLVKMIEVGFECSQAGWLVVVFDTRPDAEPDGEWTSLIEGNAFERPHWVEAEEAHGEGLITLVKLDGTETVLLSDTEMAEILGEMIKAVVLKARVDGVFATLPKAAVCELGVEHFDGHYGWPHYEDRGQENLVEC